jgi:hypothetical protein
LRILFVAMPGSVHAARWTRQLAHLGWDLHLFGATATSVHPSFEQITVHGFAGAGSKPEKGLEVRGVWPIRKGTWHAGRAFERLFPRLLARTIERLRPDLVHSLEIQHSAYLTLAARRHAPGPFPPWFVTNWGSDIAHFGRMPEHASRIRGVLEQCDYYSAECIRDVALAHEFGFRGRVLGVLPNAGGVPSSQIREWRAPGPSSARPIVVVKGHEGLFGLGVNALRSIELAADDLRRFELAVVLAGPSVRRDAAAVAARTGLTIRLLPRLPHEEMLRLFGRARFTVSLSRGDGINTSSLEALAMGALPIQSRTSCLDEWITDGETGLLVDGEDVDDITTAIRRAATDDALVDAAAAANEQVALERLDERLIRERAIGFYDAIAADRDIALSAS